MPGVWIWSGSSSPDSTSSSTSATVILPAAAHHRVEVARGLAIDEVAPAVALPRLDDGEVAADGRFEDAPASVEERVSLPSARVGARRRWACRTPGCRRRRHAAARPASPADTARPRACRRGYSRSKILFSPTYDEIIFRTCPAARSTPRPLRVDAAVVRDDGQVVGALARDRADAVLRVAAEAEAARQEVASSVRSWSAAAASGNVLSMCAES